jgi:hypothetical protein
LIPKTAPPVRRSEALGTIATLLPIFSALLAYYWVGSMPLLFNPGSTLTLLLVVTIVGTSILVAVEADSVGAGSPDDLDETGRKREGPAMWCLACILLWIVVFPLWMARRSKYGLKNLCGLALLTSLIFLGVFALMCTAINETASEAARHFKEVMSQFPSGS